MTHTSWLESVKSHKLLGAEMVFSTPYTTYRGDPVGMRVKVRRSVAVTSRSFYWGRDWDRFLTFRGGGPRVVVSTAAFHARVRGSVPGLGGLKETIVSSPSTCES